MKTEKPYHNEPVEQPVQPSAHLSGGKSPEEIDLQRIVRAQVDFLRLLARAIVANLGRKGDP